MRYMTTNASLRQTATDDDDYDDDEDDDDDGIMYTRATSYRTSTRVQYLCVCEVRTWMNQQDNSQSLNAREGSAYQRL